MQKTYYKTNTTQYFAVDSSTHMATTTTKRLSPDQNPILHRPWDEPSSHWHWIGYQDQLEPELRNTRRPSQPSGALGLDPAEVNETDEPHATINNIRNYVGAWRKKGFRGSPARKLLINWHDRATEDSKDERAFFCQREAVETLAWLFNGTPIDNSVTELWQHLHTVNTDWNDNLPRVAIKMATGAGKTRVMAMFRSVLECIHPEGCQILVITPNLTVKDRLQELKELRRDRSIVPISHDQANPASITIENYHTLACKDRRFDSLGDKPTGIQKKLLQLEEELEEPKEMLNRVLGEEGDLPLYVFQDEGHHCRRDQVSQAALKSEELDDVRQWYTALLAITEHRNLKGVIDLSATPAYLEPQSGLKTPLFPWCVTDFGVEDAIESGICKIPRLPFKPDQVTQDQRLTHLYEHCTSEGIPRRWEKEPPREVQNVFSLLAKDWKKNRLPGYQKNGQTPAIIVVVNLVHNARILYQWLAGTKIDGKWAAGKFDEFSNIDKASREPKSMGALPTLLVHSKVTDPSWEDAEERQVIQEQLALRAPEKSRPEAREIIREIFQTVGKRGEPGEHIRCVISVSMLSEGWDAKTVTHVFGYRAFGSLLLCEQVIGRSLRRPDLDDPSSPEYAEVFGVPYPGLRGTQIDPPQPKPTYDVYSVPDNEKFRLKWPMIDRFEYIPPKGDRYYLDKTLVTDLSLDPRKPLIEVIMQATSGTGTRNLMTLGNLDARSQAVLYELATRVSARWFSYQDQAMFKRRGTLFVDAMNAIVDWCTCDNVNIAKLAEFTENKVQEVIADHVIKACVSEQKEQVTVLPIWSNIHDQHAPTFKDTSNIEFRTTLKNRYPTHKGCCRKSEINIAACHSGAEQRIAQHLERDPLIRSWVRNFRLGWKLPWWDPKHHQWREYEPDFLIEMATNELRFIVIEMKGIESDESAAKSVAAVQWCEELSRLDESTVPGNWHYLLVTDPNEIKKEIKKYA